MAIINFSNFENDTQETQTKSFDKGPKVILKDNAQFTGKIFYLNEKENNRGDGRYISIGISIDNHNCTVFDILNIENKNENTVLFAKKNIKRILDFNKVKIGNNFDSSDLEGMNVCVTLGIRKKYNSTEDENFVKFYNSFASKTVNTEGPSETTNTNTSKDSWGFGAEEEEEEIKF